MFKKSIILGLAMSLMFSLSLAGCSGSEKTVTKDTAQQTTQAAPDSTPAQKPVVAGFIFSSTAGDGGWTYQHNEARKYVEKELGSQGVKTIFKESVPEGPDVEKVAKDMIDQGANIIFGISFGYRDYLVKVAKEHPEVKFMHSSGDIQLDNMSTYFGRIYQPRYLSGIVAGMKSKSNKIGYVAAFDIPQVIRGIDAFTLGVRAVNPNARVIIKWTNTWYDPAKEKDAAKALLDEGCDVIAQHQDTTGPQVAAEEKGAFAIGYHSDSKNAAPKAYMTAPVWDWGKYYVKQIKAVMEGTWKSENYWGSMNDGVVFLAPLTDNAPAGAKEKVAEMEKKIRDGSWDVFTGPIKDQDGVVRVPEGVKMTDKEMWNMNWFVEGVEGKITKK